MEAVRCSLLIVAFATFCSCSPATSPESGPSKTMSITLSERATAGSHPADASTDANSVTSSANTTEYNSTTTTSGRTESTTTKPTTVVGETTKPQSDDTTAASTEEDGATTTPTVPASPPAATTPGATTKPENVNTTLTAETKGTPITVTDDGVSTTAGTSDTATVVTVDDVTNGTSPQTTSILTTTTAPSSTTDNETTGNTSSEGTTSNVGDTTSTILSTTTPGITKKQGTVTVFIKDTNKENFNKTAFQIAVASAVSVGPDLNNTDATEMSYSLAVIAVSPDDVIIDDNSMKDTKEGLLLSFYIRLSADPKRALIGRQELEGILTKNKKEIEDTTGHQVLPVRPTTPVPSSTTTAPPAATKGPPFRGSGASAWVFIVAVVVPLVVIAIIAAVVACIVHKRRAKRSSHTLQGNQPPLNMYDSLTPPGANTNNYYESLAMPPKTDESISSRNGVDNPVYSEVGAGDASAHQKYQEEKTAL
ncbi:hypothetical protein LSAT2_030287 [Lamellibrachia satsuma]|nr:hypothetical protein LSAT2_030287 [Lamellibrachia satsuma]